MKSFRFIHDRALARKGEAGIAARLPQARTAAEIAAQPDDRWLSAMTRCVFSAGFVWRVIEAKWPGFEEAFRGFDPFALATLDAAAFEELGQDTRIVRNRQKIDATLHNANFVLEIAEKHGSFGQFVAEWPDDDLIGLLAVLKARGKRLGGDSGPRTLRMMGKPAFILTRDVVGALVDAGVVDKKPTSKSAMRAVQAAFNAWSAESGLNHSQLSMILALSFDAPKG